MTALATTTPPRPRRALPSAKSPPGSDGSARRWWPGCHACPPPSPAGLLLCLSFPPFGWWYTAIVAFALLAWVLTRDSTTLVGGFGYGFLFGAAFNIPLLPWTGVMVGLLPWLALAIAAGRVSRLVRSACGCVARRLTGWPIWFAGLWALAEWAKSTVPFGGFPWGVVGFGQTDGPLLPLAQVGGAPLVSFAVTLLGFSLAALVVRNRRLVAAR